MLDWPKELADKYDMTNPQVQISTDDKNNYRKNCIPQRSRTSKYAPIWIEPVEFQGGFDNIFKPMTRDEWKENPTRKKSGWLRKIFGSTRSCSMSFTTR